MKGKNRARIRMQFVLRRAAENRRSLSPPANGNVASARSLNPLRTGRSSRMPTSLAIDGDKTAAVHFPLLVAARSPRQRCCALSRCAAPVPSVYGQPIDDGGLPSGFRCLRRTRRREFARTQEGNRVIMISARIEARASCVGHYPKAKVEG